MILTGFRLKTRAGSSKQWAAAGKPWNASRRDPVRTLSCSTFYAATPRDCTHFAGCAGFVLTFRLFVLASSEDAGQKLEAIRLGAQDYLVRPFRPEQLAAAIRRSLFYDSESGESEIVADEIEQIGDDMFFVAASPSMRKMRAQAELLAQTSAPVLISGENGSGKELAARLIHKLSVRSGFRFLKINCATLPGDVQESELFGVNSNGRTEARQTRALPEGHALPERDHGNAHEPAGQAVARPAGRIFFPGEWGQPDRDGCSDTGGHAGQHRTGDCRHGNCAKTFTTA